MRRVKQAQTTVEVCRRLTVEVDIRGNLGEALALVTDARPFREGLGEELALIASQPLARCARWGAASVRPLAAGGDVGLAESTPDRIDCAAIIDGWTLLAI